jgi:hypothetical protein
VKPIHLRPLLTFDAEVDEPPEGVPGGRELADLMLEGAVRHGLRVIAPVEAHESFGWSFMVAEAERPPVWRLLQCPDAWLLITRLEVPLAVRLFSGAIDHEAHRRVCEALHAVALERPEISHVGWSTLREYQSGGAAADRP